MSWFYGDWSWVHSLVVAVAVVMTVGVVVCAIVTLIRDAASARHDDMVVTNGFVPPSPAKIERRRHAPHQRNVRRAA